MARKSSKANKRPARSGGPTTSPGGRERLAHMSPAAAERAGELSDGAADERHLSFPIVAVGASAGGLEAFSQLLEQIPPQPGMAIIFVQHLAPKNASLLPELLATHTKMPVEQVVDGVTVKPNHVYVIPPDKSMSLADGALRLTKRLNDHTQHTPIDTFFSSLANYAQSRAIGVILSGTASDGANGIKAIKAAGGITIAQQPESAKFDGMPRAAIGTEAIDLVLSPADIAAELVRIAQHPYLQLRRPRLPSDESPIPDDQMRRIFQLLRSANGVDFSHYKLPTIHRRLHRRMMLHKISAIDHYLKYLEENAAEVQNLFQDILIHVTRFFREPESFESLKTNVFPKIIGNRKSDNPIRIWVPGCSTGEEPYSVSISLLEYLAEQAKSAPIQLFATDLSETAIERARAGLYPESIATDVSPERLRRFFTPTDGSYQISKQVRDLCVFARQDLTHDPPFSKLDLIVCRNVLIYLDAALQKKLMNVFHYALKTHGFLLLGHAETIGLHVDLFTPVDKKHRLYTKKPGDAPSAMTFPIEYKFPRPESGRRLYAEPLAADTFQSAANRILLDKYTPPGIIVDAMLQIVQFRGVTGPFLEPAPGEASLHLLKMAREGLVHGLRTALRAARSGDAPVRREGLYVKHGGQDIVVDLEVIPLGPAGDDRHYLILFDDVTGQSGRATAAKKLSDKSKPTSNRKRDTEFRRLEQELSASREYLQSIIQDLEATNEELQSANEEILSSNEELQSTNEELDTAKEELQSTNEELNTLNEELHGRNEELSRVNSDLVNLLASVQIAIVIISGELRIRRFTPMAEKVLNLIPSDVGRPIGHIKPNIDCPDLEELITGVMDTMTVADRTVHDRQGNGYLLRVRPYKNIENRIDGAVLALFDIEWTRRNPV